jgi:hypothetical protein
MDDVVEKTLAKRTARVGWTYCSFGWCHVFALKKELRHCAFISMSPKGELKVAA